MDIHKLVKLAPTLQEGIKERNGYFGDIILFEGTDVESKVIRLFTRSRYTHTALRIEKDIAISLTPKGKVKRDLSDPPDWVNSYLVLEHREIDPIKRKRMEHNNKMINEDYDLGIIWRLGFRHLLGRVPDLEDISNGGFSCSSNSAYLHVLENMTVMKDVNCSQIEPQHFLEGGYFKRIGEWER
jgi:hypothetical protein